MHDFRDFVIVNCFYSKGNGIKNSIMMQIKKIIVLLVLSTLFLTACRSELIVEENSTDGLKSDSEVAMLMRNTSLRDGSNDNILDHANCFSIELPVTVIVNGIQITVNTEGDFESVEDILDEFDDDDDTVEIIFPIQIIFNNFNTMQINSISEFNSQRGGCNGENENDNDIECIDFQYPISATIYDTVTEQTDAITINNDNQLHDFLEDIDSDDVVSINFPISLVLFDGTVISIDSLEDLETVIENAKDDCDEDDDYDHDDDDCEECTPEELDMILVDCTDWTVDKLELNGNDLEDNYDDFTFNFSNDGTLIVQDGSTNHSGTWSSSGSGENIKIIINIPTLSDFNTNWNLHEIEDDEDEKEIDLRRNNDDRLRFESTCN